MSHVCERCGGIFDDAELNFDEKMILDASGEWKREITYRCYECAKRAVFG